MEPAFSNKDYLYFLQALIISQKTPKTMKNYSEKV